MTDFYDSPGPIAKSSSDLALLAAILLDQPYDLATMHSENLSVGFLSPSIWCLGSEMCRQYERTAEQMASHCWKLFGDKRALLLTHRRLGITKRLFRYSLLMAARSNILWNFQVPTSLWSMEKARSCQSHVSFNLPECVPFCIWLIRLAVWEFKNVGLPGFIQSFETCDVNNLEDLVNFNEANKHQALPSKQDLDFSMLLCG